MHKWPSTDGDTYGRTVLSSLWHVLANSCDSRLLMNSRESDSPYIPALVDSCGPRLQDNLTTRPLLLSPSCHTYSHEARLHAHPCIGLTSMGSDAGDSPMVTNAWFAAVDTGSRSCLCWPRSQSLHHRLKDQTHHSEPRLQACPHSPMYQAGLHVP